PLRCRDGALLGRPLPPRAGQPELARRGDAVRGAVLHRGMGSAGVGRGPGLAPGPSRKRTPSPGPSDATITGPSPGTGSIRSLARSDAVERPHASSGRASDVA